MTPCSLWKNQSSKIKEHVESIHGNFVKMHIQILGVLIWYAINTPEEDLKIWWEKAGGGYLNLFWKEDLILKKGLVLIELHFHPLLMLCDYLKSTIHPRFLNS